MLGKLLLSFLISISPLGEMKAGLPLAILKYGLNPWVAFLFCLAGNLLIFPLVDYLMTTFGPMVFKSRKTKERALKFRLHTKKRTNGLMQKYGFWGLMVFVMIPLPGTGAYLGTIASYAFDIDKTKAFKAISLGVIGSGIIMQIVTILTQKGIELF